MAAVGGVCRVCGGGVAVLDGGGEDGAGKCEDRARGTAPGRGDRRRRSISAWSCAHSSCFSLYCCFCRRTSASREVLLSSSSEILSLLFLVASEYASELRRIARSRAAESRRAANWESNVSHSVHIDFGNAMALAMDDKRTRGAGETIHTSSRQPTADTRKFSGGNGSLLLLHRSLGP